MGDSQWNWVDNEDILDDYSISLQIHKAIWKPLGFQRAIKSNIYKRLVVHIDVSIYWRRTIANIQYISWAIQKRLTSMLAIPAPTPELGLDSTAAFCRSSTSTPVQRAVKLIMGVPSKVCFGCCVCWRNVGTPFLIMEIWTPVNGVMNNIYIQYPMTLG
jgi:hypothetical protein